MRIKKTLIITRNCFPPVIVGPAILLGNLFKRYESESYCVLMGPIGEDFRLVDVSSTLSCKYYFTSFPNIAVKGWRRFRSLFVDLSRVCESVMKGIKVVKREKVKNIFLIPGYLESLTALLVHWIMRRRLILYLPDIYYVPNRFGFGWTSLIMRLIEPILLRCADTILVTAEPTQNYYEKRYNSNSVVLPHSVDLAKYETKPAQSLEKAKETRIVFTGEVSEAQLDSILNMVKTVNTCPELNATFVIAANASKDIIESLGIKGPRVIVTHANRDKIPDFQQSADILFLPLSFIWPNPEIVRTASPSKMPEYLAAGRPIIVHAPTFSYVANYARSERFALVVDQPDCGKLRQAIIDLKHNKELCHKLVTNARRTAMRHDSVKLSAKLQSHLI